MMYLAGTGGDYTMQETNNTNCLGNVVKSARQAMRLTQSQLAGRLGITVRYLKAIENSGHKPSYDLFIKIVRELDISADTVVYPDDQKSSAKIYKLGVTTYCLTHAPLCPRSIVALFHLVFQAPAFRTLLFFAYRCLFHPHFIP
jgi:transcriptional regulator with XRE-family HTH domain